MPVDDERQSAFRAIVTDRPIAYHPLIAKVTGSVTAGVLLSQLAYWDSRTDQADGWIWKTQDQLYEETGLGRREQETARRVLRELELLEEAKRGVPAKLYFRVNLERLAELIVTSKDGGFRHTRMDESANQEWPEAPGSDGGKRHPSIEKITSETTVRRVPQETISKSSNKPTAFDTCIADISRDLGDHQHMRSNKTRAANLMEQYRVPEDVFIRTAYDVHQGIKARRSQIDKPMPYWFASLEERLKSLPQAHQSLAGKYWRHVQR